MNKSKSSLQEKVFTLLKWILGLLLILIGLPFLPFGLIFIGLGVLCFLPIKSKKKRVTSSTTPPTIISPITPIITPPTNLAPPVTKAPEKPPYETHKVAGVTNYRDNILRLASDNSDYDLSKKGIIENGLENHRIYKYDFYATKTELIPEPTNPHDPKAIKVIIDGEHVGYIKSGSCSHVLKLINEDRIVKIDNEIYGGAYKIVLLDEYDEDDKGELEKDTTEYGIKLTIFTK